jgi:hypothetical protein
MEDKKAVESGYHARLDWSAPSKVLFNVQLAHTFPTTADAVKAHLLALMRKGHTVAVQWFVKPEIIVLCHEKELFGTQFERDVWRRYDGKQAMYIGRREQIAPDTDNNADWWQEVDHFCVGEHVFLRD